MKAPVKPPSSLEGDSPGGSSLQLVRRGGRGPVPLSEGIPFLWTMGSGVLPSKFWGSIRLGVFRSGGRSGGSPPGAPRPRDQPYPSDAPRGRPYLPPEEEGPLPPPRPASSARPPPGRPRPPRSGPTPPTLPPARSAVAAQSRSPAPVLLVCLCCSPNAG